MADKAPPIEKVIMVIKVDLDCSKCRRKIKKVLCSIPQVQNQVYDEKTNTVTITVVCCCPEKIKQKICCKGGESIKGIEILKPQPPKPKPPPTEKPKEPEKPKQPEKPKEPEKPKQPEKPKEPEKQKEPEKPKETEKPKPQPTPLPPPVTWCPPPPPPSQPYCCPECYHGIGGGPCYRPPPRYEGYGMPVYDSWGSGICGGNRTYYVCRPDYFYEENPSGCVIM